MPSTQRAPRPSWTTLPAARDQPATILDYLVQRFPRVALATWQDRFERDLIFTADGPLRANDAYRVGLRVGYFREVEDEPRIAARESILHLDDQLVVADKPHGLPVTPGGRFVNECLLYRLERRLDEPNLVPLHRLDRATAGLVVFCRQPRQRAAYFELFERRRIFKSYIALGRGPVPGAQRVWHLASRLERGTPFFRMRSAAGSVNAITRARLLSWQQGVAKFALWPKTGKKHQLRLHMASLGYPIVGDRYYPELQPEQRDQPSPLCLLAAELRFIDPFSGQIRVFRSRQSLGDSA